MKMQTKNHQNDAFFKKKNIANNNGSIFKAVPQKKYEQANN